MKRWNCHRHFLNATLVLLGLYSSHSPLAHAEIANSSPTRLSTGTAGQTNALTCQCDGASSDTGTWPITLDGLVDESD